MAIYRQVSPARPLTSRRGCPRMSPLTTAQAALRTEIRFASVDEAVAHGDLVPKHWYTLVPGQTGSNWWRGFPERYRREARAWDASLHERPIRPASTGCVATGRHLIGGGRRAMVSFHDDRTSGAGGLAR